MEYRLFTCVLAACVCDCVAPETGLPASAAICADTGTNTHGKCSPVVPPCHPRPTPPPTSALSPPPSVSGGGSQSACHCWSQSNRGRVACMRKQPISLFLIFILLAFFALFFLWGNQCDFGSWQEIMWQMFLPHCHFICLRFRELLIAKKKWSCKHLHLEKNAETLLRGF